MQYTSVVGMMSKSSNGQAPIPTQSYDAANMFGTAVPKVGDSKGRPDYTMGNGGTSPIQVVFVVVTLIGVGYLLYHLNFE